MIYKTKLVIGKTLAEFIRKATNRPEIENSLDEDEVIIKTAHFENGYTADIKCCGVDQDDDITDNSAWTEGILYDEKGNLVTYTEPDDDFFGKWDFMDDNGNKYVVEVVAVA